MTTDILPDDWRLAVILMTISDDCDDFEKLRFSMVAVTT
jgi:hypothetical protein